MTSPLNNQIAFTLLDNQPQSVIYYTPVWTGAGNDHVITDFQISFCNKKATCLTGMTSDELTGQRVLSFPGPGEQVRPDVFRQLLQVYHSGTQQGDTFFNPTLERYFSITRTRVEDGVLSIAQDITHEVHEHEEKERQRALNHSILDNSLNGFFACEAIRNEEGTIIDLQMLRINPVFTRMTGYTEEQVIGKRYLSLFPSGIEYGTFALNCQVIKTGISARKELYYKGEGLDAWYDVSLSRLGKDGLLVSFSDITEQKKAFLQVEQQKTLLDNILKHSANGISVTEMIRDKAGRVVDGRTILANDAAVNYAGIPRELYLTKTAVELEPNIIHSPYYQLCLKTLETGEPQFTQYCLESTKRWLEITVSRLDDNHIITIFTDVTATRESQVRQQQLVEELKRSNANLEEFAHAASHDLKEPIRKIQFFADRLKQQYNTQLDEGGVDTLSRLGAATDRMRLLVDDLLSYSMVSVQPREMEDIDLNQKLTVVLDELELAIQEKGAEVQVDKLPTIRGYRRQLQQLFINLVGNALKYSKPGTPPRIYVSARPVAGSEAGIHLPEEARDKPYHLIEVQDNGIGFAQEDADRIFNMFTRLHGNNEYKGTGVGLSIARKVVQNHHGFIWAESQPGEGATFKLLLPV